MDAVEANFGTYDYIHSLSDLLELKKGVLWKSMLLNSKICNSKSRRTTVVMIL